LGLKKNVSDTTFWGVEKWTSEQADNQSVAIVGLLPPKRPTITG
jgi:hypothetical protein